MTSDDESDKSILITCCYIIGETGTLRNYCDVVRETKKSKVNIIESS